MIVFYLIIIVIALIYLKQEKLLLQGEKIKKWKPFLDYSYEEIYLPIKQKRKTIVLHGILYKSKNPSKGIIVYYHGNKGNLDTVGFNGLTYLANDYDLAMLDYRGNLLSKK